MNSSREWGGGTNLARALETLQAKHSRMLTKNTVIIIVSDTKTLEAKKAAHMLKLNGEKVKEIVWLNTLPKADWNQHKAVREFARVSKMFECYTLAHLERIIASQFR